MTTSGAPPSGGQYSISAAGYRATVVEVGGGLRECYREDRPVLQPYPLESMCDGAHGAALIPWPNRLADGRYSFDGQDFQVALTEPDKRNAIHGFLRWRSWEARQQAEDRVTMGIRLHPMPGYPFALDATIEYRLDDQGLTVRTTMTNVGDLDCPVGCGHHPYLSPGIGKIDECELQLDAETRILTSSDRELPTGREPVADTAFDFRTPRALGELAIDSAFTDLCRDDAGRSWVRLRGGDGYTSQLWVDDGYTLIELFTGDDLGRDRRRRGLGTEPMTCPPNAFQTGEGVIRLAPGESTAKTWGVQLQRTH